VDDYCAARSKIIPPLPWPTFAPPFSPVTVTQPVTFLQLVWAVVIGAIVFAEPVDLFVVLGGMVIMASVLFITWREAVLRKQAKRAVPAP
jgi:drug/metabolite transporter (DMT)-like permease